MRLLKFIIMKKNYMFLICVISTITSQHLKAQCPPGEMDLRIEVSTDDYGYEGYWQLIPFGNACGTGTIWEGGNDVQVGCLGGGDQDATTAYGYGDNITISESIGCVSEGTYDLIYVDDWGDGGMTFHIVLDNIFPMYHFMGMGTGNTFTFEVTPPLDYDASITAISTNAYVNPRDVTISGTVANYSANTITSFEVMYSIDGGPEVLSTLTGLNIAPFEQYSFSHPIVWNVTENGDYNILLQTGKINGNNDLNIENDTLSKLIIVGDPIPNIIDDYFNFVEDYIVIGNASDEINNPTDLDFHPVLSDYQLWITNKGTMASGGSTVTFWDAGKPDQTSLWKQDGNAWHFMLLPTSIAFSENTNFATGVGAQDANHSGGTFTGPTLWSSDMDIYGEPSGGNGSHIDMLHQSPYTMGVCADEHNAFYAFCDWHGHIHYYDFQKDHGPGNDDHADGIVRKYTDFSIEKINENLPCHITLDKEKIWLFIVDAGNGRIMKLNTTTGNIIDDWAPTNEPLEESTSVVGCEYYEIVTEGLIEPVGISVIDNYMLVSDHANGDIIIYDHTTVPAVELKRLHTGRTGLMGITLGPDGHIWFVDQDENELVRVDPTNTVAINDLDLSKSLTVYPNPSNGNFQILFDNNLTHSDLLVNVINTLGEIVYSTYKNEGTVLQIDISSVSSGTYILNLISDKEIISKNILIMK